MIARLLCLFLGCKWRAVGYTRSTSVVPTIVVACERCERRSSR